VTESSTGTYSAGTDQGTVKQTAEQGKQAAGQVVSEVRETAADQAQRVGAEARTQARTVAADVRDKLGEQARSQNDRLVSTIRETADHLDEMRGDRAGTPASAVVSRVADGGRQLADYLDQHGPDGVLREVQDFARRRPGAFLATALAAGFVVGRLGKSVAKADPAAGATAKPATDTFTSGYSPTTSEYPATTPAYTETTGYATGYPAAGSGYAATGTGYEPAHADEPTDVVPGGYVAGTEYAATGTGTPLVVEEEYPLGRPETRP
jgi:hypothetical protein